MLFHAPSRLDLRQGLGVLQNFGIRRLEALNGDLHGAGRKSFDVVLAPDNMGGLNLLLVDLAEERNAPYRHGFTFEGNFPGDVSAAPATAKKQQDPNRDQPDNQSRKSQVFVHARVSPSAG